MSSIVSINQEIVKVLRQYQINVDEAKLYLLGIYFGVDTQYISEKTITQVNALGIVTREYSDTNTKVKVIWKVPLFNEEKDEAFAWIDTWMDGFKKRNPSRRGTKSSVMKRMKKFFAENPEVRVDDIFKATSKYFSTVTDPQYLKSSHKFIYEGTGFQQSSMLLQYVEMIRESGVADGRSNKMKG